MTAENAYAGLRERMVRSQIASRGVRDPRVLAAMRKVPRHAFVPTGYRDNAYDDRPLPIGNDQTISQPYIVAAMTEALLLEGTEKVLEIGMGSGYQAAVLAELAAQVYTVEQIPELAEIAHNTLVSLGYASVVYTIGDGTLGWPEHQPYDAIIVTAGAPRVPRPLVDQLAPGGRLVIPVGDRFLQELLRVRRDRDGLSETRLGGCRFVPLEGEHGW